MRYLVLTGNHPRHLYYLNHIVNNCNVVGAILEKREEFIPIPPNNLERIDRENFIKHFNNRAKYEKEYFGEAKQLSKCPIHYVSKDTLSNMDSIEFIKKLKPDVIFVFGVLNFAFRIKNYFKNIMFINLNTGLIQRYNGDATLFWPFYFLEPNWAGSTFHLITDEPDAGDIIHQSVPILEKGDTIHEVACKVVRQSSEDVIKIINVLENGKELILHKQTSTGKNFLTRDFMPQHLRMIYNIYDDNIVSEYLEGRIKPKNPKLMRIEL